MRKRNLLILGLGLVALLAVSIIVNHGDDGAATERQQMIHDRGNMVMPFDLDKTTHRFDRTDDGGVMTVQAKDAADSAQITLIQEHLSMEAQRFSEGDFGDPKLLHGDDMPGLAVLSQSADDFTVTYTELPDGASLRYTTSNPEVVDAFHVWFMAQMMDHGADASGS